MGSAVVSSSTVLGLHDAWQSFLVQVGGAALVVSLPYLVLGRNLKILLPCMA